MKRAFYLRILGGVVLSIALVVIPYFINNGGGLKASVTGECLDPLSCLLVGGTSSTSTPTPTPTSTPTSTPTPTSTSTSTPTPTPTATPTVTSTAVPTYNLVVEESPIVIERVQLKGNTQIAVNSHADVLVAISSAQSIDTLQSVAISLYAGHVTKETWLDSLLAVFTFQEYQDEEPLRKYFEDNVGKNWGLLDIPIFIPEYNVLSEQQDGKYTIIVEVYTNHRVVSRGFIPVLLGNNNSASCDVNHDGRKSVIDIVLAMKALNGEIIPSGDEKIRIDKNNNGEIDLKDIMILFPCVMGENLSSTVDTSIDYTQKEPVEYQTATPTPEATPATEPIVCTGDPLLCLLEAY